MVKESKCRKQGGNGIRNWEFGLRPIGACAYPPACKPYGLYGLEAAPAGKRKTKANSIAQGKGERGKDERIEAAKLGR